MITTGSKKLFYIDSRNRLSGSDSEFSYELKMPPLNSFTHACVLDISVPKSYYLVNTGSNTFTLVEDAKSSVITLAPGNYNTRSLTTSLGTLLSAASPNGWTYTVTYPATPDPITGLLTFTVSGNLSQPSLVFPSSNIADILGFSRGSTNSFVGGSLISTKIIDLQSETTLYLHSSMVSNETDDILQEVFANAVTDFGRIQWQCTTFEGSSRPLSQRGPASNIYTFRLTNEEGEIINLNGQNMQFTLCVYEFDYSMVRYYERLDFDERRKHREMAKR